MTENEQKVQKVPIYSLPFPQFPLLLTSYISVMHLIQLMNRYGYTIINEGPLHYLRVRLCIVHSTGFGKYIMTYTHYYNAMQNSFTALKILRVPPIHLSLLPGTSGNNWSFTVSVVFPFPECCIVGMMQYVPFSNWPVSLRNTHLSVPCVFSSLLTLKDSSTICIKHPLCARHSDSCWVYCSRQDKQDCCPWPKLENCQIFSPQQQIFQGNKNSTCCVEGLLVLPWRNRLLTIWGDQWYAQVIYQVPDPPVPSPYCDGMSSPGSQGRSWSNFNSEVWWSKRKATAPKGDLCLFS